MGWFPPQELGTLAVGDADSGGSLWPTARWVVLAATLVLAAVAVVDLAAGRRRRQVALG
jgi:hypothetical protein